MTNAPQFDPILLRANLQLLLKYAQIYRNRIMRLKRFTISGYMVYVYQHLKYISHWRQCLFCVCSLTSAYRPMSNTLYIVLLKSCVFNTDTIVCCSDVMFFTSRWSYLSIQTMCTSTHGYCTYACFDIQKLCIIRKECICVFHMVLTMNSVNRLIFVAEMQRVSCEVKQIKLSL
jgi:hypothetical protein